MDKLKALKISQVYTLWGVILIVWSLYRVYIRGLPEWLEELVFKPLLFLGPVLSYVFFKEKQTWASVGIAFGHFVRDLYLGLGIGFLFILEGVFTNTFKYGRFNFSPIVPVSQADLLKIVTLAAIGALVEEVLVRGFLYTRLAESYGSKTKALLVSSLMYFLLLVPFIFVVSKLTAATLVIFLLTNLLLSVVNTLLFNQTKTLTVPTLTHAFWNLTVALYL